MMSRTARILLQLEGALVLGASVWAYGSLGGEWLHFVLVFLLPDLSMLGYLKGPGVGAWSYNLAHTYLAPALLAGFGLAGVGVDGAWDSGISLALIWFAHIGLDRAIGYGLKHRNGFRITHLGADAEMERAAASPRP